MFYYPGLHTNLMADAGIYILITVCLIHCSVPVYSGFTVDRPFLRDTTPTRCAGPEHPSNSAPLENGIYMLACTSCTSVLLCVCVCVISLLATSLSSLYVRSVGLSPALRLLACLLGSAVLCESVVCRWCSASTAWVLSGVAPRYWVDRSLRFHVQIKVAGSRLSIHGAR